MKKLPLLYLTFCFCFFTSHLISQSKDCATDTSLEIEIPNGPKPWNNLELNNNPCQFQFAIVTDRTGGHRPGIFMEGIRRLNLLQPEFVMSVGDLIEGYTEDREVLDQEWAEFNSFIDSLQMPFFYLPGNHDITNKVMEEVWKEKFGPTYYHFVYKDVLFLCLNSEDQYRGSNKGTISDEQYAYIEKTLAANAAVKWTMVFLHQPLWILEDTERWPDVEQLLSTRKHSVFVGHHHNYAKYERNNGKYFMLATTGGGSRLRGPQLGEFDHVVWITMTEQGPIIANLQLDGIWDENVSTEQTKEFLSQVWKQKPIYPDPLLVKDGIFTEGTVGLKITNDKDVPMHVKLKNSFSWDLQSNLDKNKVTIPPNSVEFVELVVKKKKEKPLEELEVVKLSVKTSYEGEQVPEIEVPFEFNIGPELTYNFTKATKPVKVDGQLAEWPNLKNSLKSTTQGDMEARFDLSYDDQNIYIAIDVQDDNVFVDTSLVTWKQDFAGFVLNGERLSQSVMDMGEGRYENSIISSLTPATATLPSTLLYEEDETQGVEVVCKQHKTGYALEAAIPLTYIQKRQGKNWETVRFNIIVQDYDAGKKEHPRYFWKPAWNSQGNRVGSGLFFKQ